MNQETNVSVSIKPLSMKNYETIFLAHNIFRVTLFDWQRCGGKKILDEHSKRNEIRLLCV